MQADFMCYVSDAEECWLQQEAQRQPSTLICTPNGASPTTVTDHGLRLANQLTGHKKFALFCASAHPPNIYGFWHYFERGLGCLSPDERLVIVGSSGTSIAADIRTKDLSCFSSRCIIAGEIEQEALDALVDSAHTIVLPITNGSGTNLKTAEALLSRHHVITTTIALRGFERIAESDGVYVADEVDDFLVGLRASMEQPPLIPRELSKAPRSQILWDSCLSKLVSFINAHATEASDLV
jgi:hypothetical protein